VYGDARDGGEQAEGPELANGWNHSND
jgi:hypothetical protein